MSYYEDEADYAGDYDYTPEMYEDDLATHEINLVYEDMRAEREDAEDNAARREWDAAPYVED